MIPIDSESLLSIRTTPIATDVCQDNISYLITWDGTEVTELSSPVKIASQNTLSLQLTLGSDDLALIGSHILKVIAIDSLGKSIIPADPSVSGPYADQTIVEILEPCAAQTLTTNQA